MAKPRQPSSTAEATPPPPEGSAKASAPARAPAPSARAARASPLDDGFGPLPPETLEALAASSIARRFPRNAVLINEGEQGDSLFIVLSGRLKVYASNAAGKEIVIDFHGPGECVGEMSIDGSPRSASVMTTEPTTCAIVSRVQFRDFLHDHPEFALYLIGKLIQRARRATENVKSLALSDVYGRLVRLLNALAREVGGRLVVTEKLTQQEIAERVGSSRDMITRLMKDLVAGGYLRVEERTIVILKRPPAAW
jgi:CRP/FNR family cyclic AMP-dependent transcriptional regulator